MVDSENKHMIDPVNQYSLTAKTMYLASMSLTENLNLDHVLDVLLTLLENLIPYDSANVMLLESESFLRVSALRGYQERGENDDQIRQIQFSISDNPILKMALAGSVKIDDTINHPDWEFASGVEFVRNWIGVPLIVAGKLLGLYSLDKAEPNFFTAEHVHLAELLAPQAATAIQNARLYSDFQQKVEDHAVKVQERTIRLNKQYKRQVILADLEIALVQSKQLEDVLQEVVDAIVHLIPTDDASIILWNAENDTFFTSATTVSAQDPSSVAQRVRKQGGASSWIIKNKKPLVVSDIRNDSFGANKMLSEFHYSAYLGVPLLVQDESLGVLYGLNREICNFQQTEVDFMSALANQTAITIKSVALLENVHQKISQLKTRLAESTLELSQANEKLTELDRLKTKFMHDVSHELRTPLANINLYIELLDRGNASKREHYLNVLKQSVNRMGHLVEDILHLSNMEIDAKNSSFKFVSFNQIIDRTVTNWLPQAEAKQLEMVITIQPNLPPIWGDLIQLGDAISILIENAISFTQKGQIEISGFLDSKKERIGLQVNDTGIGIISSEISHLFEPFYRSERVSQSTISGMGVGLTILRKILDLHQGEIEIQSQVDVGSSFTIWLPVQSIGSNSGEESKSTA